MAYKTGDKFVIEIEIRLDTRRNINDKAIT